ncbi:TVP38/TMEM64 family protein [Butyrivibrio sp. AE3004]|uniref:TVP38/TMEM64 family protein n=1 Tax=Butyrivibrio sp. AE3004 TaxID=1506994 RepID=UPI000494A9BD|nr:VTT domain-containing protein [Butyrivibrio sp. AE3004]
MSKTVIKKIAIVMFIILFLVAVYFCIGQPIIAFVNDRDSFAEFIESRGFLGWVMFCLLIIIQTLSTCIPGTPFYISSGLILGGFKGALICDLGATIGNTIAFILGKTFGTKLLYFLFSEDKISKVENHISGKNPILIHMLFMLLPLPKDTYAWVGYHTKEKLITWIILTFICRFPHIFIYTFGGAMILEQNYAVLIAGASFAILVYVVIMIYLKKNKYNQKNRPHHH